jgi:predicted DNA-binding transcriptional regulator AlpA
MDELRLIREPELRQLVGLSHTTIWRLARSGKFPRALRISARAKAWRASDINQWLEDRSAEQGRRGPAMQLKGSAR